MPSPTAARSTTKLGLFPIFEILSENYLFASLSYFSLLLVALISLFIY